jgi:hypothetical protein
MIFTDQPHVKTIVVTWGLMDITGYNQRWIGCRPQKATTQSRFLSWYPQRLLKAKNFFIAARAKAVFFATLYPQRFLKTKDFFIADGFSFSNLSAKVIENTAVIHCGWFLSNWQLANSNWSEQHQTQNQLRLPRMQYHLATKLCDERELRPREFV